jgi:hypothetical protein
MSNCSEDHSIINPFQSTSSSSPSTTSTILTNNIDIKKTKKSIKKDTKKTQVITGAKKDPEIGEDGIHLITRQPCSEHTKIRKVYIRRENEWKYINISYFLEWRVKRCNNMMGCTALFNGLEVKWSSKTDTHFIFDFRKIREIWFDYLGMTETECKYIQLEDMCMAGQLEAMGHYSIPIDLANGCIFSTWFTLYIIPIWKPRTKEVTDVKVIEVEEEYVVSNIHKTTHK